MAKTFYEVVMEGHYNFIYGMLEGFKLAVGKKFIYYFSHQVNVKMVTLSEVIKEWFTLKTKLHHVFMEEKSWSRFKSAVNRQPEGAVINENCIKSVKVIINASFEFKFECYSKKYGDQIKSLLKSIPRTVKLVDYKPKEKIHLNAKGIELYTPDHDYIFEGDGSLVGDIDTIIRLNKKFKEHPLIDVTSIVLELK